MESESIAFRKYIVEVLLRLASIFQDGGQIQAVFRITLTIVEEHSLLQLHLSFILAQREITWVMHFRVMPFHVMPFRVMPFSVMPNSVIDTFKRDAFQRDTCLLFAELACCHLVFD